VGTLLTSKALITSSSNSEELKQMTQSSVLRESTHPNTLSYN